MANKSNQNEPAQKAGAVPERSSRSNEFDDAVTTDIPEALAQAFDEHQAGDRDDLFITDVSLTQYADIESDDVLPPGTLLRDRFEIVELVYAAGMSHVYKAVDQLRRSEGASDIHVAIKTMRPSIVDTDQAPLLLKREASIAQSLSHPNIINIFDFDDHDGQVFLVMEWLEGESVNAMLRRTSGEGVETDLARTVITGIATGVQHVHRNDVVHADINPSNIFITDAQEIKLLDFGVARFVNASEQSEDDRFAWVTQTYASPEVLSGLDPVVEDDVFSLACVVYRLLMGKHPFGGTLSLIAKNKGMSVEAIPGLPANEWEILHRALSYERSGRPDSVDEFVTWGASVGADDKSAVQPARRIVPPWWPWPAAVAAVVILAGGLWLFQRGVDDKIGSPVESTLPQEATVAEPAISASEALVIAATQALSDGQLIAPDEVNARALFRTALALEPDNADALRGLRTISDSFVQEAQEALNRGSPIEAYAALTVATETDSANPAIGIVDQLLAAKGNAELADARLAVTTGDLELAAQSLSRAERYQHIEPTEVQAIRQQIEEREQSELLDESLAAAESVSSSPAEVDSATEPVELTSPQLANEGIETAVEATEVPDSQIVEEPVETADETIAAPAQPVVEEQPDDIMSTDDLQTPQVAEEQLAATLPQASEPEPAAVEETGSDTTTTPADTEVRRMSVQELGITDYVAPEFPRRAMRRNISGLVEVKFMITANGNTEAIEVLHSEPGDLFSRSAINAIDQWRFKTREKPFQAQIVLRFEQD